jgi:hypothetical protein
MVVADMQRCRTCLSITRADANWSLLRRALEDINLAAPDAAEK